MGGEEEDQRLYLSFQTRSQKKKNDKREYIFAGCQMFQRSSSSAERYARQERKTGGVWVGRTEYDTHTHT